MNVDRYLRDYGRSVANLPSTLATWCSLSGPLREHYADELMLVLARRPEVLDLARMQGRLLKVIFQVAWLDAQVLAYRHDVHAAMGFDPQALILSAATARGTTGDTSSEPALGMALPALAA